MRGLDLALAGVLGALFLPALLVIALAIRTESRGPALFRQVRVGRNGQLFVMLKFRSMHIDAERQLASLRNENDHGESITFKMKRDPRVTRVGRLLRRSSLDELPQLWNIVVGDMTLVGPRPPTPAEVNDYELRAWARLGVRPGLTGLWQISGRSELAFPRQLELDRDYIQDQSLWRDLRILARTLPAVLGGRGAY